MRMKWTPQKYMPGMVGLRPSWVMGNPSGSVMSKSIHR